MTVFQVLAADQNAEISARKNVEVLRKDVQAARAKVEEDKQKANEAASDAETAEVKNQDKIAAEKRKLREAKVACANHH